MSKGKWLDRFEKTQRKKLKRQRRTKLPPLKKGKGKGGDVHWAKSV